jgi:hypothetical protein
MQAVTLFPGNGWIRGDQAVDPKVLQELERLRIENSDIRKQLLESQSSELTFPADVPGPEEPFDYVVSVRRYERKKGSTGVSLEREDELVGSISLGSIFVNLYDAVLVQSFEGELEGETGSVIAALLGRSDPNKKFELYPDYVRKMRVRLEALGLIRTETKKIPGPIPTLDSQGIVWSLTDKGRQYITRSLAGVSKA